MKDELNLKRVTLHDPALGPLLRFDVKPNPKTLGPKYGALLSAFQKEIAQHDPNEIAKKILAGEPFGLNFMEHPVKLEPTDVWVVPNVEAGFGGLADRGTQLLLDARMTPELAREGMTREVIRHVQSSRKEAGLDMEDRIELYLGADEKLAEAITEHRDYMGSETLVAKWSAAPLGDAAFRAEVKVDGQALVIELRKMPR
jgi:isoleucyl-tRNA synthetase